MDTKSLEVVNGHTGEDDDDVFVLQAKPVLIHKGSNSKNPISVESYSEDDDLRRDIIRASLIPEARGSSSSSRKNKRVIDLSQDYGHDDDDDVRVIGSYTGTKRKPFTGESVNSKSETNDDNMNNSADGTFMCDICVDEKPKTELFYVKGCTHFYCSECMVKYVASKLQENITNITCPVLGCKGRLELEYCLSILPSKLLDRWGDALCEAAILSSEKFYCPRKDCSALSIDDGRGSNEAVTRSDCPNCRRTFCAKCRVPWHSEVSCEEFQDLNKNETEKEDIMLMNLAEGKRWKRCPKCKFYVEKSYGCQNIKCRCGCSFCYRCGEGYVNRRCSCGFISEGIIDRLGISRMGLSREDFDKLTRRAEAWNSSIYQVQNMRRARAGSSNPSQMESSMADVFDVLTRRVQTRSSGIYQVENGKSARTGSSSADKMEIRRRARMWRSNSQVESSMGDVSDVLTRTAQMASSSVNQGENVTRAQAGSSSISQVESSSGDVSDVLRRTAQMASIMKRKRRARMWRSNSQVESSRGDVSDVLTKTAQTASSTANQVENMTKTQAGSSSVSQMESLSGDVLNMLTRRAQMESSSVNQVENMRRAVENLMRAGAGSSSIPRGESLIRSDIFNMFRPNAKMGSSSIIQVDNTRRAQAGSSSLNQEENSRDNILNIWLSAQTRTSRINQVENVREQFGRKV